MIDILLCIISSASLIIIFKIVSRYQLQLLPVITVNYGISVLCSIIVSRQWPNISSAAGCNWLPLTLLLGIMFITVFGFVGMCTAKRGITVTAIAQKMSLVIPISAAFFLYSDHVTPQKVIGIVMALCAIILTTRKGKANGGKVSFTVQAAVLPLLVFFGSGIIDALINYVQKNYLVGVPYHDFLAILFGTACLSGTVVLIIQLFRKQIAFSWREVLAGIALGIPNYCSMYFVLRALEFSGLQSSVVYPVLNIGVVTTSALVASLAFREKLTPVNMSGILLAIAAIIALSHTG